MTTTTTTTAITNSGKPHPHKASITTRTKTRKTKKKHKAVPSSPGGRRPDTTADSSTTNAALPIKKERILTLDQKGSIISDTKDSSPNGKSDNMNQQSNNINQQRKKKSRRQRMVQKDPKDAAQYLESWKKEEEQEGTTGWKFNKNTQSWLLRHMYEGEKVSKTTFALLLEYITGIPENAKQRIIHDATNRAFRYRTYQSQQESSSNGAGGINDSLPSMTAKNTSPLEVVLPSDSAPTGAPQLLDDEARWQNLSDHDKRKEYKRARKVIETLSGMT